jgi:hypothetical protein
MSVQALNEAKKLVKVLAVVLGDLGDIVVDGTIDWSDSLKIRDLVWALKDLVDINYSVTTEEFENMTEDQKDELIQYFNDELNTEYELGEEVAENLFAFLMDLYMMISNVIDILGKLKMLKNA